MPLNKNMSVSSMIKELADSYKESGKIGTSTPKNKKAAMKQAAAIAYNTKRGK